MIRIKYLILSLIFVLSTVSLASCEQTQNFQSKNDPEVGLKDDCLVYLSADSVDVSSFDATPDWAPLPEANAVIDGSLMTRWSSNYTDNQWIVLDFGKPKVLSRMVIFWEAAHATGYDILASKDNIDWQEVSTLSEQDGDVDKIEFSPVEAQFVKIVGRKRLSPDWGISVWELVCLGPASQNSEDKSLSLVYPELAKQLGKEPIQEIQPDIQEIQPSPGVLSLEEFQKGVVYTSWGSKELAGDVSDETLEYLKDLGVGHLGIMVVWYQDTIESSKISRDSKDTPEDEALIHAINKAHSLGMKVKLKPHVDVKTDEWRGDIIPSEKWFASYKKYIMYYVGLAEQYNVECFSIGTELGNATLPKWQGHWEELISQIREAYSGRLLYSANWDEFETVGFWDKLDFIGIDAYFPLTEQKDPAKEELIAAWQGIAQGIEDWLKKEELNKPVVFSEIGYSSADGTNTHPWAVLSNLSKSYIDQEEQADSLEAMFVACSAHSWFKGIYWWNYFPQDRWSPLGFIIRGKRAEEILADWLKKL